MVTVWIVPLSLSFLSRPLHAGIKTLITLGLTGKDTEIDSDVYVVGAGINTLHVSGGAINLQKTCCTLSVTIIATSRIEPLFLGKLLTNLLFPGRTLVT